MKTLNIEIRSAEGGNDSKLFVQDLQNAYLKFSAKRGWTALITQSTSSDVGLHQTTIKISGKDVSGLLNEAGGHRIQRVSPTEKRGRVHTSTVTVAVLDPTIKTSSIWDKRSDNDFSVEWFSGTGKGGQRRNKVKSSCRLTHIPTGITKSAQTRKRTTSYTTAKAEIELLLDQHASNDLANTQNKSRKSMVGSGQRADKIRTYRFQDDIVVDHNSGKTGKCSKILKGGFDILWI